MLKNAYFPAKIGADTAENKQHFAGILTKFRDMTACRAAPGAGPALSPRPCRWRVPALKQPTGGGKIYTQPEYSALQIFGGLVLGCIKTKFCTKICV